MHRCCQCHQSPETKGHMYGEKAKGHASFLAIGEQEMEIQNAQVNFIKQIAYHNCCTSLK